MKILNVKHHNCSRNQVKFTNFQVRIRQLQQDTSKSISKLSFENFKFSIK